MNQPVILVTGGTGFAGSHLIEALLAAGYQNIHATHFGSRSTTPPQIDNVQFHQVDLTNREATLQVFEKIKPDQIYNLASFAAVGKSFEVADSLLKNNIGLQLNVLEGVRQFVPHARVLSIGSAEEYGLIEEKGPSALVAESHPFNPVNPYAVSKVTQELLSVAYLNSYKLQIIRVRPFNHIGERQSPDFVIPAFISQLVKIERGQQSTLKVGLLSPERDFTDVKDTVRGYITLMEKGVVGEVYNVGSGVGRRVGDVLQLIIDLSGIKVSIEDDPSRHRPSDIPRCVANNQKITALGWQPIIPLEETVQRILTEWRNKP